MKLTIVAVLALALSGCADLLYKKKESNYWGQLTPEIGKIIND